MATDRLYTGDTAVIDASLFEDDGVSPIYPQGATWNFVYPDGTDLIVSALPASPVLNQTVMLSQEISPFPQWAVIRYDGTQWNQISLGGNGLSENVVTLTIPADITTQAGLYRGACRFTLPDNTIRSQPVTFETIDPLADRVNLTNKDGAIELTWLKLEDLFDSELGGPHLMDVTKAGFTRDKVALLLPDALYKINNTYQPATGYDSSTFPYDQHLPLLSQALLVQSIRHLMRSYVEQYNPVGSGNITYFDRRDYLNRWQQVYQVEDQQLEQWIDLFKRDQMGFGQTATLVGGYASFYGRYPRYMRSGFPYVYRF